MPSSPISPTSSFTPGLAAFAADLTAKFAIALHFNPEDQLKAPLLTLLTGAAEALGLTIDLLTEVQDRERSGRPDIGVVAQALLAGYVELKAPGKGADPGKFKTPIIPGTVRRLIGLALVGCCKSFDRLGDL